MALSAAGTAAHSDLHSFRLAHPVVRSSSSAEVTAVAVLSMLAMTLWLVVLPLEIALHLTVSTV
jgi:hypothetical protein